MENITKQDLDNIKNEIISEIKLFLINDFNQNGKRNMDTEWLRSKAVRKILEISPATLQNLRISGKIRSKKILGSYYYNSKDLKSLFENN
ncbi:helix-turn-helix domain-containing protein [Chryseobacterium formosus]|uniref:Helix-turn-helix domain-containing protein n=1 Tax=Chryseobacterium formosus TaxID=1537363 RepID=A0ABT3XR14_9FLAO|nr:helix-turn-helix domain-containing protein [Chryseobacterium formosus]MCX8524572.1 helix-turn-helix domain-containing protein [Chryseobacterium formosus]